MAITQESGGGAAAKFTARHPKVKLMCSYGGKIQPRPPNQQLVYIGGDSKLLTVDRNVKFSEVIAKLSSLYNINSEEISLKYQFPGEDLDVLISLINDDDLENMMFEYDRLLDKVLPSSKPARFRLFLSRVNKPEKRSPNNTGGSEAGPFNPDYLFGFDKEYDYCNKSNRMSGFDLGLWTIPSTVGSAFAKTGGDENGEGNDRQSKAGPQLIHSTECATGARAGVQFIYRVPVPVPAAPPAATVSTTDFHGGAQYRMVPVPMGIVNGFQESPGYNVVPSVLPMAPEQMKIPMTTIDRVSQKRNVT